MQRRRQTQTSAGARLLIGLVMAVFALISYFASSQYNPVTGETQFISMTPQQEIALGLQSAPQMIQQFGGLYPDQEIQDLVDDVGFRIVEQSFLTRQSPWQFEFYVLDDPQTVNAFALPGGQIFITTALLSQFDREDQLAGVLSHEIVHVLARHGAQRLAKSELTNGLVGAVAVASENASATQTAAVLGELINTSYGRDDEIESDTLGICLMLHAGYDPSAMVEVMEVLAQAGGGSRQIDFFSTHPSPENRIQRIEDAIAVSSRECDR